MLKYLQLREILKRERLPAVVVDLDAFDRNVAKLGAFLKGESKTLRLATKSVRVPALIDRVLKSGAPYKGLMCFSAEEARIFVSRGEQDILVAYPTVQESDLVVLRELHDAGAQVSLVVDCKEGIEALSRVMCGTSRPFRVVIDVDVSLRFFGGLIHLGVRRSPVRSCADVGKLLDELGNRPELVAIGAMAYEAQVAGLTDRNPFKRLINPFASIIRKLSVLSVARARVAVAAEFARREIKLELFNGGGTGSITYASHEPALTELSAGSGLLCSHLFDYYSNVQFEPACFFALQVVRASDADHVTCQGGGYIASGEPGWDKVPLPILPEGIKLVSMEATGEVQTPLVISGVTDQHIALGDPIIFRHAKAGELAERFSEYLLVSNGKVVERAKTYRGMGHCFF